LPAASAGGPDAAGVALGILTCTLALLLAAFFVFVGGMKTFAPVQMLQQHHAWTTALPAWLGRLVGASELACALGLAGTAVLRRPRLTSPLAVALIVNQLVASAVHLARGEVGALPQNAVLIGLLLMTAFCARVWSRSRER
jgi:hypothetical protein